VAEHSPLPLHVEGSEDEADGSWLVDANGHKIANSCIASRHDDFARLAASVNLIGPHLDNPRLIAAVEALAKLAADKDDPTAFEMACDFLTERAG
jgi:hypothetical protein